MPLYNLAVSLDPFDILGVCSNAVCTYHEIQLRNLDFLINLKIENILAQKEVKEFVGSKTNFV